MKAVVFCGGEGLRFQNEFIRNNKTMSLIGGKPLLWHILKKYADYGFYDFILCVKDDDTEISDYFSSICENWSVMVLRTGNDSNTGERLKRCEPFISEDIFLVTYGDGLSDVDLDDLIKFHVENNALATLTAVKPVNPYGVLNINNNNQVVNFSEKPIMDVWVNGGFFVFNKTIFKYLTKDTPLETGLLKDMSSRGKINAYKHSGNWKSMDTFKDYKELCDMWNNNKSFW